MALLEVIAYDLAGCIHAEKNGADRIELCADPHLGGTTPSLSLLEEVLENVNIPINAMVRPRGGDFYYSSEEFKRMIQSIKSIKDLGASGVVFGVLHADHTLDISGNQILLDQCGGLDVTFHRAFDQVAHPFTSIYKLMKMGFNRVLTSGQKETALEGKRLIADLISEVNNGIIIMPGSGITSSNIHQLDQYVGAKEYHASAKRVDEQGAYAGVDENEVAGIKTQLL